MKDRDLRALRFSRCMANGQRLRARIRALADSERPPMFCSPLLNEYVARRHDLDAGLLFPPEPNYCVDSRVKVSAK